MKKAIALGLLLLLALLGCKKEEQRTLTAEYRSKKRQTEQELNASKLTADSLLVLLAESKAEGDLLKQMILYRTLGKAMRNASRYTEALNYHQTGLDVAIELGDSAEMARILNDLGTDFRRIGALGEASEYHYKALELADMHVAEGDPDWTKNQVAAFNGIGNVNLELKYYDEAEAYFVKALEGEQRLGSHLGIAINYANLGTISQRRKHYDMARSYFLLSLEQNRLANSPLGMGLCYIFLGSILEEQEQNALAEHYYQQAYQQMFDIGDKWHWLGACIPLARVSLKQKNYSGYQKYIESAEKEAKNINSLSHLVDIYKLRQDYAKETKDYQQALDYFVQSSRISDTINATRNINRMLDVRVNYERNKSEQKIEELEELNMQQQKENEAYMYSSWAAIAVLAVFLLLVGYAYREGVKNNKLLKKIDTMRSDFFAGITHEFRTPITVMLGLNDQMSRSRDLSPEDADKFRASIRRQGQQLLSLINQLLDISKLQKGVTVPDWRHGDIVMFVNLLMEPFGVIASGKEISFRFEHDVPSWEIDFVPSYVQKILSNLVSNAIKYSRSGDSVRLSLSHGRGNKLVIRVVDTGVGIISEDLDRIFEPFYRSASAESGGGSGIGLSFTRTLVENLRGTIEVQSQLGKGSTFTVTLPITNTSPRPIKPWIANPSDMPKLDGEEFCTDETEVEDSPMQDDRPTILLVEDNKDVGFVVKLLVEDAYNVVLAGNGKEGLVKAQELVPDLIITDILMPQMKGTDMCRAIKESKLLNHIPVIMISALTSEVERLEGLKSGADAYLVKPFSTDELRLRIDNILADRKLLKKHYMNLLQEDKGEGEMPLPDCNMIGQAFLKEVSDIVYEEMTNPLFSSPMLADRMHVSLSQLNRKLTAVCGMSSSIYVLHIKIRHACKLLRDTDKTILEISELTGFSEQSYFSRAFKKQMNCTPSQYRQTNPPTSS
ncbi:hypothetical protein HQ45_00770 [Porphyromonas crevioricanis]|nr:hypothetical protein HQ45_00770 [Porphyromonas crevioricanis]